jgi:hypothetical protein
MWCLSSHLLVLPRALRKHRRRRHFLRHILRHVQLVVQRLVPPDLRHQEVAAHLAQLAN